MTEDINTILTILEVILINEEGPSYLECSFQNNFIYILLSKVDYKYMTLSERIYSIFEVLKFNCQDILENYPIVVEAFSDKELSGLFKLYAR